MKLYFVLPLLGELAKKGIKIKIKGGDKIKAGASAHIKAVVLSTYILFRNEIGSS